MSTAFKTVYADIHLPTAVNFMFCFVHFGYKSIIACRRVSTINAALRNTQITQFNLQLVPT